MPNSCERKIDIEKIKAEVRDTLEFRSGNISGRLLFYITAKHFVINLPQEQKNIFLEMLGDLQNEVDAGGSK